MSNSSQVEKQVAIVFFEVRNDKDRGNLILTVRPQQISGNVNFFRYNHQPIDQHPEQMRLIVKHSNPTMRTKTIKVDIMPFLIQYWNFADSFFEFKGVKMNNTEQQISIVQNRRTNKEVAQIKRRKTIQDSKQRKVVDKNLQIVQKLQSDEEKFQIERAERIRAATADMQIE